jgi:hypothetical protein
LIFPHVGGEVARWIYFLKLVYRCGCLVIGGFILIGHSVSKEEEPHYATAINSTTKSAASSITTLLSSSNDPEQTPTTPSFALQGGCTTNVGSPHTAIEHHTPQSFFSNDTT